MGKVGINIKSKIKIYTLVDDDLVNHLSRWNWTFDGKYVHRRDLISRNPRKYKKVYLHREIMNHPKDMVIDHINHNTLDNRRQNLRICTRKQNAWNSYVFNPMGYRGIQYIKEVNKWVAKIQIQGKNTVLGRFLNKEEAALAYDNAVIKHRDKYATTNILNKDGVIFYNPNLQTKKRR